MATTIPTNRAAFECTKVLEAIGGVAAGPSWERVVGVTTDSRAVEAGNLFVALRGERFDAHDFAERASDAGATAVVVERGTKLPEHVRVVEVEDSLKALGDLARAHRKTWGGTVVGITGSVGKTTTKELTAAALAAGGRRVLKTSGNLNNLVGVPMTLFQLNDDHDTAVIEMGTSKPGEIARLAAIAGPDVGVVTRAALSHTEGLGSIEAVADEKMGLARALGSDGLAIINGDDGPLAKRAAVLDTKRKLFYGKAAESDVRVLDWSVGGEGTRARLQLRGREVGLALRLLGEGAVLNAAGALAIAFGLDLSIDEAARGLSTITPTPGRLNPIPGGADRLIVDDTYNANPASVSVALSTARALADARKAPLVVVLGDMKELGSHSEEAHRAVGDQVAEAGAFLFVGCGPQMQRGVDVANARGVDTLWFENSVDCVQLGERLPLNAVVLIKGSRSMEMERAIAPLQGEGAR